MLATSPVAAPAVLQEITEHVLAKPLLLVAADKSEVCRQQALQLLLNLLQVCSCCPRCAAARCYCPALCLWRFPLANTKCTQLTAFMIQAFPDAVISLLPYAVPVLEERLQSEEVTTPVLMHAVAMILSIAKAPAGTTCINTDCSTISSCIECL